MKICVGLAGNDLKSSCADLIRVPTSFFRLPQGVGGRHKAGQDEIPKAICSLRCREIFPGPSPLAGEGGTRTAGGWGPAPPGVIHRQGQID